MIRMQTHRALPGTAVYCKKLGVQIRLLSGKVSCMQWSGSRLEVQLQCSKVNIGNSLATLSKTAQCTMVGQSARPVSMEQASYVVVFPSVGQLMYVQAACSKHFPDARSLRALIKEACNCSYVITFCAEYMAAEGAKVQVSLEKGQMPRSRRFLISHLVQV